MTAYSRTDTAIVSLPKTGSPDRDVTASDRPDRALVQTEIQALVEWLPAADRALLHARFGWDGHAPRFGKTLREELKLTAAQEKAAMLRSLCRLGIAHLITDVPATRALLGEDRSAWAARAWEHADDLLDRETRARYAHLLLVVNGARINAAEKLLTSHLRELRSAERAQQHRRHMQQRARDTARRDVSKLIDHTIGRRTRGRCGT